MVEYRDRAKDFVNKCLESVKQIQEIKSKVHSALYTVENLQLFLVEMREIIGDADLIRLTDNIFQRAQLRDIQKQCEQIQTQYKHIFNKIE